MNKKIILVCEDDEGIVEATKIVLEEKGYEVISALEKKGLIEKIKKFKISLLLLDLWLPDLNGAEVAREIKNSPETKKLPIIIISASRDTEKIAKEVGAESFICKPFDIYELEKKVDEFAT